MKLKFIDYGLKNEYFPVKKYDNDAGTDVHLTKDVTIKPHGTAVIGLGFGIKIPEGYMIQLIERSSSAKMGLLVHSSPIDSGYEGEIHIIITNLNDFDVILHEGDRVAQLVMSPITYFDLSKIDIKTRKTNGLGSTGK